MKIIIGLGNPGTKYKQTRHNIGFLVVDALAKRLDVKFSHKRQLEAEVAEAKINDERIVLIKPQTFMNASGRTVVNALKKYPVKLDDTIVVHDDADLPLGKTRIKRHGSSAGHKGMESILGSIQKDAPITRLRIGIGRPEQKEIPLEDFVLGKWNAQEKKEMDTIVSQAVEQINAFVQMKI